MSGPVEDWFRQLPHDSNTLRSVEEQALKDVLTDAIPANVAAERITSIASRSADPGEEIYRVWSSINEAAENLPSVHEKLVDLLEAIKQLPDLKRQGRTLMRDDGQICWKDLPTYAWDVRDRWDYTECEVFPNRPPKRQEWVNLNAFAARATTRGVSDHLILGLWTISMALEDEPWNHPEKKKQLPCLSIRVLDGYVLGAAQWIFHAGRVIFASREQYGRAGVGLELFKGPNGFSPERWNFWKKRFAWVQEQTELNQETRAVAKKALEVMEQID